MDLFRKRITGSFKPRHLVHSFKKECLTPFHSETRKAMYLLGKNQVRSSNHSCHGKSIIYKFWMFVCSLSYPAGYPHAPYYIFSSTACPAVSDFSTLVHKGTIFW